LKEKIKKIQKANPSLNSFGEGMGITRFFSTPLCLLVLSQLIKSFQESVYFEEAASVNQVSKVA